MINIDTTNKAYSRREGCMYIMYIKYVTRRVWSLNFPMRYMISKIGDTVGLTRVREV